MKSSYRRLIWVATLIIASGARGEVPATLEATTCVDCTIAAPPAAITEPALDGIKDLNAKIAEAFNALTFLDPETIEKTDSRLLGEMIVRRLHAICDSGRDPSLTKPAEGSSEIMMLVPRERLSGILEFGFKNQHQTNVTGGCDCKANRLRTEGTHVLLGIPYSNKARDLLPKYALQVFKGSSMGQGMFPSSYGDVIVRFKPEVARRATWSQTDSLDMQEPQRESIPLRTNSIRPQKTSKCLIYCEAQVWGQLDVTDVASIAVKEGTPITKEMKEMGVPIYTYKLGSSGFGYSASEPATSSVQGLTISDKPISTGTALGPGTSVAPPSMGLAPQVDTSQIKETLRESVRRSQISTGDLMKEVQAKKSLLNSSTRDVLSTPAARALAEISARPKTPEIRQFLIQQFNEGRRQDLQAIALSGLNGLSSAELKPLLITALKAQAEPPPQEFSARIFMKIGSLLGATASFMALKFKDDPEIQSALNSNPLGKQLLARFEKTPLCPKENYD